MLINQNGLELILLEFLGTENICQFIKMGGINPAVIPRDRKHMLTNQNGMESILKEFLGTENIVLLIKMGWN